MRPSLQVPKLEGSIMMKRKKVKADKEALQDIGSLLKEKIFTKQ